MSDPAQDPLQDWAAGLDRLQWSALITDADWNLRWVSRSLRMFLRVDETIDLGYGQHILTAWSNLESWLRTVTPESQMRAFEEVLPFFRKVMEDDARDLSEIVTEPFAARVADVTPAAAVPQIVFSAFEYTDPDEPRLPTYGVNFAVIRINDDDGAGLGNLIVFFIDMNPNLMALLVRGDQAMYQRMARLVEPARRETAVLFCDLHRSVALSRTVSTATYFRLIRELWTAIDATVAGNSGIVGKHAGDGASAFFLVDDLGSESAAAAAAIRTARRIHDLSGEVFGDVLEEPCRMKVGMHWGASVYMGQLVPGGRLDVTALGDEVNEAARIQECAGPHESLASKQLVERLSAQDAASLGLDLEKLTYQLVGDRDGVTDKARTDAGMVPVTPV
jgi:class 3 adenylate cyclase